MTSSDWLRECCELYGPITERGKARQCNPGYSGHSIEKWSKNKGSFCNNQFVINDYLECRRYTKLTDKTRKTTYVTRRKRCDKHLGPGWFRFQGRAGTKMPTKCLSMSRCGTYGTGWLRGTHPSVAEGAVDRTVCFRYRSCCKFSVIIRVRNCGSYYVYHLINTPACTLGYCGTG